MKSFWKRDIRWIPIFIAVTIVISFQNCAGEFQTIDEFKYGSDFAKNITEQIDLQSYWDGLYDVEQLMSQGDLIYDARSGTPPGGHFIDEMTAFFVVTNRSKDGVLRIVVDSDQILKVVVSGSSVTLTHEAPANNSSETVFNIDPNLPVIIGARSGRDPKNILIMVNAEYKTMSIQNRGTPSNFSYVEGNIETQNLRDTLIFKRTMEPGEINVISRHIASEYQIPTKTSANMPDYLAWSNESPYFPQVRALMRTSCFRCHSSWITLSESGFTVASRNTKNIKLVTRGNLAQSPFWHSLQGSVDENPLGTRNMPKDLPSLNSEQLNLIRTWIFAIPAN